jgi:hypothetical protein
VGEFAFFCSAQSLFIYEIASGELQAQADLNFTPSGLATSPNYPDRVYFLCPEGVLLFTPALTFVRHFGFTLDRPRNITCDHDFAYVTDSLSRIVAFDLTDHKVYRFISLSDLGWSGYSIRGLRVWGNVFFLCNANGTLAVVKSNYEYLPDIHNNKKNQQKLAELNKKAAAKLDSGRVIFRSDKQLLKGGIRPKTEDNPKSALVASIDIYDTKLFTLDWNENLVNIYEFDVTSDLASSSSSSSSSLSSSTSSSSSSSSSSQSSPNPSILDLTDSKFLGPSPLSFFN